VPALVVLAAGLGARYGGLKQLEPIGPGGATLLDYTLYDALRTGFTHVALVIRPDLAPAFAHTIDARWSGRLTLEYAHQRLDALPAGASPPPGRVKPWGTAHAVSVARPLVHRPFAVANADDFYGRSSLAALARFLDQAPGSAVPTYALVGYRLRDTLSPSGGVSRAVCRMAPDGCLEEVDELREVVPANGDARGVDPSGQMRALPGDAITSMNLWGFTPAVFGQIETGFREFLRLHGSQPQAEYLLPALVAELLRSRRARVRVLLSDGVWGGITHPADRVHAAALLSRLVEAGEYPPVPWS
jgi:hypothetical protein